MSNKVKILEPKFYIQNFLKIKTKTAELIPFTFNKAQNIVMDVINELRESNKPVRIIMLKARQLGMSTFTEAYIFNDTATNKFKNSMIVAHLDSASQNLYQMYKTFYENLPEELTPMIKHSNKQEMSFENPTEDLEAKRRNPGLQSKVTVVSARTVSAGRSQTIHNLHASEVAFWQDAKTLMTGLMQTIPDTPNTSIILESTANGIGGWFYDIWKKAENGENEFIPIFLGWFLDPEYSREFETEEVKRQFIEEVNQTFKDQNGNTIHTEEYELMKEHNLTYEQLYWRKHAIQNKCNGDVEMFRQEYPSNPDEAFIASGRPRFTIGVLKQYLKKCKKGVRGYLEYAGSKNQVMFIEDPNGYIEIWEEPKDDIFYCIGADVAEGLEKGDYSVGIVGDEDMNIVASWRGHIDPDLFGKELVKLARFYNEAYLGVESNNHGLATLKAIQNEDYYNIYYSKIYDKISETVTQKIGWQTNRRTKPLMIDRLAEWIREKWIGIPWKTLVQECLTYIIEDNGSTNAQEGCYDDTVMAAAILLQMFLEGKGDTFTPVVPEEKVQIEENRLDFLSKFAHKDLEEDEDDSFLEISK